MNHEDDMPVGECVVCGEQLDHSKAGFCKLCSEPFCWDACGGWFQSEHRCIYCQE